MHYLCIYGGCVGFSFTPGGSCVPYSSAVPSETPQPGVQCVLRTDLPPPPPLPPMPGLHPAVDHSCPEDTIPMGAYQVGTQMPDGTVQNHHYLVCSDPVSTYRGALQGTLTSTRASKCPATAPLYVGFSEGVGPCAPLAAGWSMTTTCKSGDNQGPPPPSLPATYVRYIGCLGIPNDVDYAITEYEVTGSAYKEELQAVKCCKVVPV